MVYFNLMLHIESTLRERWGISANTLTLLIMFWILNPIGTFCDENESKGTFLRTLLQQEKMEDKLTAMFKQLFQNYTADVLTYSSTFMYVCDKNCITQNMFGNGLTSAFLLAVLSERKFAIYPNMDSTFYHFCNEAAYLWKADMDLIRNQSCSPMIPPSISRQRYLADLQIIEERLSVMDFELHFKADIVYFGGDHDWIFNLRHHPNSVKKLPWLYKTNTADLIRLVYNGLFHLSQPARNFIRNELITKVGESKLVCFHGNNKDKNQMQTFLNFARKNFLKNYKFYVSGVDQMSGVSYNSGYRIGEKLVKIDPEEMYKNMTKGVGGIKNYHILYKNIIEHQVLKVCNVLIVSESPSGILAAQLRRQKDNLYCYRNGIIFPCTRRLIAWSFRDGNNLQEPVDILYFCSSNVTDCYVEEN